MHSTIGEFWPEGQSEKNQQYVYFLQEQYSKKHVLDYGRAVAQLDTEHRPLCAENKLAFLSPAQVP